MQIAKNDQTGKMPGLIGVFARRTVSLYLLSCCGSIKILFLIQVLQNRHAFAFGSAVGATEIVDTTDPALQKYQDFFYNHFEWAVLENALKWRIMERTQVLSVLFILVL